MHYQLNTLKSIGTVYNIYYKTQHLLPFIEIQLLTSIIFLLPSLSHSTDFDFECFHSVCRVCVCVYVFSFFFYFCFCFFWSDSPWAFLKETNGVILKLTITCKRAHAREWERDTNTENSLYSKIKITRRKNKTPAIIHTLLNWRLKHISTWSRLFLLVLRLRLL